MLAVAQNFPNYICGMAYVEVESSDIKKPLYQALLKLKMIMTTQKYSLTDWADLF